LWSIEIIGDII